ncbi:hypothetical protein EV424DRAFT_1346030 [Suillus variegatus]|nr:hypothetical protein EV424DRAFT_1346030 [Suillus variegatus]
MLAPSCLPPFDSLAAQTGMFELSNILTHVRWLEFFIRLIPMEKLHTELYLLHFVLKGRVYLGDIWQIVGGRMLEAQREESLRSTVEDHSNRWSIERDFMEEKRDRCQLEVSLCSQAIDHVTVNSDDPSFSLRSTWVTSTQSELIFLRAMMRHAQAEAAVYTLALENSPASTYSDSDSDSSPCPTLPQHLPEEVRRYMDYIDTVSINSHTDTDLFTNLVNFIRIFIGFDCAYINTSNPITFGNYHELESAQYKLH